MPAHALTYNRSWLYSAVHTLEPCSARSEPHLVLRHALPLELRDGKREWAAGVRAPGARLEWRVRGLAWARVPPVRWRGGRQRRWRGGSERRQEDGIVRPQERPARRRRARAAVRGGGRWAAGAAAAARPRESRVQPDADRRMTLEPSVTAKRSREGSYETCGRDAHAPRASLLRRCWAAGASAAHRRDVRAPHQVAPEALVRTDARGPDRHEGAGLREDLHARVFAVGDVDQPARVDDDPVRHAELARLRSGGPPLAQILACSRAAGS